MKKILVVLVIALLALALVACGSSKSTKAKETTATTPTATDPVTPGTETTPATDSDTTPGNGVETTPSSSSTPDDPSNPRPTEGIDILWGDLEYMAVGADWKNNGCAIENHHPEHDYRNVFVVKLQGGENGILDNLVLVDDPESGFNSPYEVNADYKWVVIIDGERIEIDTFTYRNHVTWGYVRCDLGDWDYNKTDVETEGDNAGKHGYDLRLEIYESATEKLAYWAWFNDPEWVDGGLIYLAPPVPVDKVPDTNIDSEHVAVPSEDATPLEGPVGTVATELYDNLFDGRYSTKLCTPKGEQSGAIMWSYKEPVHLVSYSLVGANDDAGHPERVPHIFTLSGSNDNKTWTVIDTQTLDAYDKENNPAANYGERNFKLGTAVDYKYFKLEIGNADQYQLSEIILYTEQEYLG